MKREIPNMLKTTIIDDIVGIQPMTLQSGQIFNMRPQIIPCEFCRSPTCNLYARIINLHNACFVRFDDSIGTDYHIIARKSSSSVESFFHNILISEYFYENNQRIDYFVENRMELRSSIFKQELLALRYDLHHPDKKPYVTEDSLADHGVYFYG